MFIKEALIFCKDQKTDDELKTIMATHPWPTVHGFYKSHEEEWETDRYHRTPDAIWIDEGISIFDGEAKWIVESFHVPGPGLYRLVDDPFDPHERRKDEMQKEWWRATVALIFHQIPDGYQAYSIFYGEKEDEHDYDGNRGGGAAVAEEAWRSTLLEHFNYAPEVVAALSEPRQLNFSAAKADGA